MKILPLFPCSLFTILVLFASCGGQNAELNNMQAKVDSLQKQLDGVYRPGLGEFMTGIQTHHAKLWFAGKNANWKLADFEIHEIMESLDDIQKYNQDRPEIKSIGMIAPALDSINNAIKQKDTVSFRRSFVLLTNTCNNCHRATDHEFNVVIVPSGLPVLNQDFKTAP